MQGILFRPLLTLANLNGIKSRTSRTRGLKKINESPDDWNLISEELLISGIAWFENVKTHEMVRIKCQYGQVGSELYGKETYCPKESTHGQCYAYKVDLKYQCGDVCPQGINLVTKWKSPMMMPEVASRYHIILERIGCQRIQNITERDCIKEGIAQFGEEFALYPVDNNHPLFTRDPKESFKSLLDTVSPDNWNRNLWNWVLYYRVVLKNKNN